MRTGAMLLALGLLGGEKELQAQEIPSAKLDVLKASTVFVKVRGDRIAATGSGFVVHCEGATVYVVTNRHVVLPQVARSNPRPGRIQPRPGMSTAAAPRLTLVLHSGTPNEQEVPAELIAFEPERDLAVLKAADAKNPPLPLDLNPARDLQETRGLWVLGFPFGQELSTTEGNPALTIGKGTVASIRKDKHGVLAAVQIDGALNPGNSGGPVVDNQGRLIGVATASILGAGIGLAIPAQQVTDLLGGQVVNARFTPRVGEKGKVEIEVRVGVLDPLKRLRMVQLSHRLARAGEREPPEQAGQRQELSDAARVFLTLRGRNASGVLSLEANGRSRLALLVQLSLADDNGLRPPLQPHLLNIDLVKAAPVIVGAASSPGGTARPRRSATASAAPAIRPPVLNEARVVKHLPGPLRDVAIGGGGRYLILHLASLRKLAIFDVNQLQVTRYLELSSDRIKFTAGREMLLVGYLDKKLVERWNLKSLQREAVSPLASTYFSHFKMGLDSDGPLFVDGIFVDPKTLKPLDFQQSGKPLLSAGEYDSEQVRVSADGTLLGIWQTGAPPSWMSYITGEASLRRFEALPRNELPATGPVLPAPDGRHLFAPQGVFTPTWRPFDNSPFPTGFLLLPAVRGPYYLSLRTQAPTGPCVCVAGDDRPLARFPEIDLGQAVAAGDSFPLCTDKRILFIPEAKLLILLPLSNDQLIIHQLDLEAELARSEVDFLHVTSLPPVQVQPGTTLQHDLAICSKRGGVRCRLIDGPVGMELTPAGVLTWSVPSDMVDREFLITVAIRDASGQEHWQTLALSVGS